MEETSFHTRLAELDARLSNSDLACGCIVTYGRDFVPSFWFGGYSDPPRKACNACFVQISAELLRDHFDTAHHCDECGRAGVMVAPFLFRSMTDPMHTWVMGLCIACALP